MWSTDDETEVKEQENKGVKKEEEKAANKAKTDAEWEQTIKERQAKMREMSASELAEYNRIKPVEDLERLLSYNKDFRHQVMKLVKDKWGKSFKKTYQVMEFLRGKGVEVENISTDEASLQAWLKTMEECR